MNRIINRWRISILLVCLFSFPFQMKAGEGIDVQDVVFSHIKDAYSWHITEIGEHEITIPLPVIVKGETSGWHIFSSSRLDEGKEYEGFVLAREGKDAGKIVERSANGEWIRPLDLSLTKNACGLLFSCMLLSLSILGAARWYKRHPGEAPGGLMGAFDFVIDYIYEDVIKKGIGPDYRQFSSYLFTVFFFILFNNLLGVIPVFPGGVNLTGNITITMTLAFCTFVAVNLFGTKKYWKEVFWPETPLFLKVPMPIMPFVEFFGVLTKPFALMIRLFANIMAGHTIILALTSVIFITVSLGAWIHSSMTVVSVAFSVFMNCLELFVACLQAYIFTLLSANYIGAARIK